MQRSIIAAGIYTVWNLDGLESRSVGALDLVHNS